MRSDSRAAITREWHHVDGEVAEFGTSSFGVCRFVEMPLLEVSKCLEYNKAVHLR